MKENEKENLKDMEKNSNSMDEKVHYEIKFVETEDGYRLEASGDKEALRRLGIGPHMVGRKRRAGHGHSRGRRGTGRARHARRMGPRQRRRAAMMARRRYGMHHPGRFEHFAQPECADFANGPRRGPRAPRGRNAAPGYGRPPEKEMPDFSENTWDW